MSNLNEMQSLFNLKGKTAVITGGNKGIGMGMALGLARAGADIIVTSASIQEQGSEIETQVKELGRSFKAYRTDLSDRKALYSFKEKVLRENEGIDILKQSFEDVLNGAVSDEDVAAFAGW